jgi:5-methylcytosine-specific restriction endonuclease McrA
MPHIAYCGSCFLGELMETKPRYNTRYWIDRRAKLLRELGIVEKYIRDHHLSLDPPDTSDWTKWRKLIYSKGLYRCQMCNESNIVLHAHHVYPRMNYPALEYDPRNGVCLCKNCHFIRVHQLHDTCDAIEDVRKLLDKEALACIRRSTRFIR